MFQYLVFAFLFFVIPDARSAELIEAKVAGEAALACGRNQIWLPCGTACPPTCKHPIPPKICTRQCVRGCHCKPHYYLNSRGYCLTLQECIHFP